MKITAELKETIDMLLSAEMTQLGTIGTSLGIVYQDKLIYTKNYGAKDLEARIPPDENTLFNVASVTKSIVCLAILKLVEDGMLSLDDPVNKYLPLKLGSETQPILIRHLMSHTSGIPDLSDWVTTWNYEELYGITREIPKIPFISWSDVFTHINDAQEFIDPPESRFYYNNICYGMLGEIIRVVSGEPFQIYIKKNILEQIRMIRSGFKENGILEDENLAKCYVSDVNSKMKRAISIEYPIEEIMDAAGGLFSSIKELANYAILHLNQGKFNGNQIVNRETIAQMQNFHFVESHPNTAFQAFYGEYGKTGYGYGFVINEDFFGTKLVQHSGSYSGASAWIAMLPEKHLGVVMLSNKHPSPRMFAQAVLIELLGKSANENFHVLKLRKHHEKLSGRYEAYKNMDSVEICDVGGQLYVTFHGDESKIPLVPIGSQFETHDYSIPTETGGKMVFQFEINERITWIRFERNKWKKM